jgi:hypothetical protein
MQADITAILTLYRRPQNLAQQVEALRNQTIPPKEIWVWINYHEDNEQLVLDFINVDRVFDCNHNWTFFGRFAAGLLADTQFVAIFDDDTIPGKRWFENCLSSHAELESKGYTTPILGSAGVLLNSYIYDDHSRHGWPSQNTTIEQVDLVGHAWFFAYDALHHFWQEKPLTWANGEDIHFSYCAQKYGGIQTFCPPHPPEDKDLWGSLYALELGEGGVATSWLSRLTFFSQRDQIVNDALKKGWITCKQVKPQL